MLIALTSLVAALLPVGKREWPARGFASVGLLAIIFGVGYTAFSEWFNISVRRSWAYSDWMPVINFGPVQIGFSPLIQ